MVNNATNINSDVNNATNINKTNNHLSPQLLDHKKCHDVERWKSRFWLGTATQMWQVKLVHQVLWFIVLNATFNNISVISWRSVLLVEATEVSCENQ
jgi:hypothetical protein